MDVFSLKNGDYIEVNINKYGHKLDLKGNSNKRYLINIIDTDISYDIYYNNIVPGQYMQSLYEKPSNIQINVRNEKQNFEGFLYKDSGKIFRRFKKVESKIFSNLEVYNKILVIGPPRCGSTIITRMIANDLNYYFADECLIGWKDEKLLNFLVNRKKKFVLQANLLIKYPEIINKYFDKVICVNRKKEDILISMSNINFNLYLGYWDDIIKHGNDFIDAIYRYVHENIKNVEYVNYDDLDIHPLFDRSKKHLAKPMDEIEEIL